MWYLPHEPEADDPPEVAALAADFNQPIMEAVGGILGTQGYQLSNSDVMIKLTEVIEGTADLFQANVRFIKYLQPDIMTRIHFEHMDWALILPDSDTHRFFVNLDRFKVVGDTRQTVPAWEGRLHTRLSSTPGDVFFFEGMDQQWAYSSLDELETLMSEFLGKFERLVIPWLGNLSGVR